MIPPTPAESDDAPEGVNFDLVRENAGKQGVDLQAIAILYAGLTEEELESLKNEGLLTHSAPDTGTAIGRFRGDSSVAFPEKATAVHYLGAD